MHWERGWTKTYQIQNNIHSYTYQNLKSLLKYQLLKRGWIQAAADSILRLTWDLAAGYELRLSRVMAAGYKFWLTPSYGWLEFRRLDMNCSWFYPEADSSFGDWIRVTADSILRLILIPALGYNSRLIPFCLWLWVVADSSSRGSIRVPADSIMQLTRVLLAGLHLQLTYILIYQVSLRTCSTKCIIFFGLFSTTWFQLPLIQALAASSRTLKTLEEAWGSLKKLQGSSYDWF